MGIFNRKPKGAPASTGGQFGSRQRTEGPAVGLPPDSRNTPDWHEVTVGIVRGKMKPGSRWRTEHTHIDPDGGDNTDGLTEDITILSFGPDGAIGFERETATGEHDGGGATRTLKTEGATWKVHESRDPARHRADDDTFSYYATWPESAATAERGILFISLD